MKKILFAVFLGLLPAAAFAGAEVAGVKFDSEASLDGKKLSLNGAGLRVKVIFKVYAAALYAEKTSREPARFFELPGLVKVDLRFLRNVSGEDVAKAISDGFAKNSSGEMEKLSARLADFTALIPDVKKGGELSFNFRPGRGVEVLSGAKTLGEIKGDDFSSALLKVWLGADPADEKLKKGLLSL